MGLADRKAGDDMCLCNNVNVVRDLVGDECGMSRPRRARTIPWDNDILSNVMD